MEKKFITGFLSGAIICSIAGALASNLTAAPNTYPVQLDGKNVSIEGYNVEDYTYFKLRDIADTVGGFNVDFKDDTIVLSSQKGEASFLALKDEGMFSSGGTVTKMIDGEFDSTTNWLDSTRKGNTAHVDHANVLYQIPENEIGLPMVFLHGYGQSRMCWMTTPDGREGWSTSFLRKGHSVFLVDQPRRGEAGSTVAMTNDSIDTWSAESKEYMPGDQAWYTHFRIGRTAPERYDGSQFPEGEEVQNQFFRQMTPNTGSFDQAVNAAAMDDVMKDVKEKTGEKSVYVTHSQGGRVGWDVNTENVAAIVAIEPGGTPEIGSEQYKKFLDAKIPMIIYFGDYIDNGPSDIQSTSFWKNVRDEAVKFAESYNADGGNCTVINLPDIGMTGNSHFMFQEKNSEQIAAHVESWIKENVN